MPPLPPGGVWSVFAARHRSIPPGTLISLKALPHCLGKGVRRAEFSLKYAETAVYLSRRFLFRCNSVVFFLPDRALLCLFYSVSPFSF